MVRVLRVGVAAALGGSGALMYAASWQRWAGMCPWWGYAETEACAVRTWHLYDFLPPWEPWTPVGDAAQLGGLSLLVLALALPLLPWVLTGGRPGPFTAVALLVAEFAVVAVGVATLRSGLAGEVVSPVFSGVTMPLWFVVPAFVIGRLGVAARGWPRAAAILLVLSTPLVATFSYAIGPFDAQPWSEGISGALVGAAGLCLLAAAARRRLTAGQGGPAELAGSAGPFSD